MNPGSFPEFYSRELSWLEFNQRVLNETSDASVPILERLKFLAISASNLDEFFMVRVGGLHLSIQSNQLSSDVTGLRPEEQLDAIRQRVEKMVREQYHQWNNVIVPGLEQARIKSASCQELNIEQLQTITRFFEQEVYSSLSPIAAHERFPLLSNQTLNLLVRINFDQSQQRALIDDEELFGERILVIPLGKRLPRYVFVPSNEYRLEFVLIEDVVRHLASRFFPDQEILETVAFRVTRNADMRVDDEVASDLLESMEDLLNERTTGDCVRVEIESGASEVAFDYLKQTLQLTDREIYECDGPLSMASLMPIAFASGFEAERYESWEAQPEPAIDPTESIFRSISQEDHVLFHPYQSFDPVVRLLTEAAEDERVLAIKQTLYRTARNSQIIAALQRASASGKNVTVVLELKARFDEARNISWARQLEQNGANVIYGVKGLKTHAKATLIVRREENGIARYCHFGTGNYNEQTSEIYTDISLLTRDPDLGADAADFFNAITGFSRPQEFRKIAMAPTGLRKRILDLIAIETANARRGSTAFIRAKVNSLVDSEIIRKLYEASAAGVKIDLNIRGICCLVPGIPGQSENIRVISLIDRYLEHARLFHFHHGGDERVYLSSADWMPRNLDKRIELLVPIEEAGGRDFVIKVLETYFRDNVKAYELQPSGEYVRLTADEMEPRVNSQRSFYEMACERVSLYENRTPISFTPHRSRD